MGGGDAITTKGGLPPAPRRSSRAISASLMIFSANGNGRLVKSRHEVVCAKHDENTAQAVSLTKCADEVSLGRRSESIGSRPSFRRGHLLTHSPGREGDRRVVPSSVGDRSIFRHRRVRIPRRSSRQSRLCFESQCCSPYHSNLNCLVQCKCVIRNNISQNLEIIFFRRYTVIVDYDAYPWHFYFLFQVDILYISALHMPRRVRNDSHPEPQRYHVDDRRKPDDLVPPLWLEACISTDG